MPTYEYACPKCGIVETYQSIKDDALTRCPQCKRSKVTRLLSVGGGIIFKGSGFWETDYNRSADYKAREKSDSAPATPAASESSGTSESTKATPKTELKKSETPASPSLPPKTKT